MEYTGRKGMLLTLMLVLMAILSALYGGGSNAAAGKGMAAIIFLFLGAYSFTIHVHQPGGDPNYTRLAVGQMACYAFGFVNQYTTPIAIGDAMQSIRPGLLLFA